MNTTSVSVPLTPQEMELIDGWYQSAAGESRTLGPWPSVRALEELAGLLKKLNITPHFLDEDALAPYFGPERKSR